MTGRTDEAKIRNALLQLGTLVEWLVEERYQHGMIASAYETAIAMLADLRETIGGIRVKGEATRPAKEQDHG